MAIGEKGMLRVGKELNSTVLDALTAISDADTELITLYYGADVPREDAEALAKAAEERFPDAEVGLNYGGQPVYYYFVSAE